MGVFSRYNPRATGGVLKQAHPNAEPYPFIPLRTTTRVDSQWGKTGRVIRVQPHERGKTFTSTPLGSNGGTISVGPSMSSGCGGACGGCGGCKGMPLGRGVNKRP
jgi:hypothetical protein